MKNLLYIYLNVSQILTWILLYINNHHIYIFIVIIYCQLLYYNIEMN